jgi:hypothetical protein
VFKVTRETPRSELQQVGLQTSGQFMGLSAENFLLEKVRVRAKCFNTILNLSAEEEKRRALERAEAAYRMWLAQCTGIMLNIFQKSNNGGAIWNALSTISVDKSV